MLFQTNYPLVLASLIRFTDRTTMDLFSSGTSILGLEGFGTLNDFIVTLVGKAKSFLIRSDPVSLHETVHGVGHVVLNGGCLKIVKGGSSVQKVHVIADKRLASLEKMAKLKLGAHGKLIEKVNGPKLSISHKSTRATTCESTVPRGDLNHSRATCSSVSGVFKRTCADSMYSRRYRSVGAPN